MIPADRYTVEGREFEAEGNIREAREAFFAAYAFRLFILAST